MKLILTINEISMRIDAAMPDYLWDEFLEILADRKKFARLRKELLDRDRAKKAWRRETSKWAEGVEQTPELHGENLKKLEGLHIARPD